MTENEYVNAWINYFIGAGLLFACWWYLTSLFRWVEVRHLSRLIMGIILVVPWFSYTNQSYLAPAWLIALVEGIFDGDGAFWRAGLPLLIALVIGLAFSIAYFIWRTRHAKVVDSTTEDPTVSP